MGSFQSRTSISIDIYLVLTYILEEETVAETSEEEEEEEKGGKEWEAEKMCR